MVHKVLFSNTPEGFLSVVLLRIFVSSVLFFAEMTLVFIALEIAV